MRFTIRDVLWLTLVAAVGVAWRAEQARHVGTAVRGGKIKSALRLAPWERQLLKSDWERRGEPIDWRSPIPRRKATAAAAPRATRQRRRAWRPRGTN